MGFLVLVLLLGVFAAILITPFVFDMMVGLVIALVLIVLIIFSVIAYGFKR